MRLLTMKGSHTMDKKYTDLDQLPAILVAEDLSNILRISRAGAYYLMHSKDFPTIHIGKRMLVRKDLFIKWLEDQSGKSNRGNEYGEEAFQW